MTPKEIAEYTRKFIDFGHYLPTTTFEDRVVAAIVYDISNRAELESQ